MKFFLALTIFFSLGLSFASSSATDENSLICKPEEHNNCKEKIDIKAAHGASTKDWSHKRQEQVAAILPEKKADKKQTRPPQKVKLISPKFLSVVSGSNTKLEWSEVSGSPFYHLQVSKEAGFNNRSLLVTDEKWVKTNSFDLLNLESGHTYFWRVAAVNNENDSMFTKSLFESSVFEVK